MCPDRKVVVKVVTDQEGGKMTLIQLMFYNMSRQKQYAAYRNRLLDFERSVS